MATTLEKSVGMQELKRIMSNYGMQLQRQVIRLEEVMGLLLIQPGAEHCEAMPGLVREMKTIIDSTTAGTISRDAAIVMATQKAVHYKIATYGSLEQLASALGMDEISNLLHQSLENERDSDLVFADVAERRISLLAETERF